MNIEFVGRGYRIDDRVRQFTEDKLAKLEKFLEEPAEIRVTLSEEKHRHIADLHVHHKLGVLQATEETPAEMHDAINAAVDKLEKQARRSRKKLTGRKRRPASRNGQPANFWGMDVVERDSVGAGQEPRIVKTSQIPIKPMSLEEAALQLESSKNDFLVFRDANHERVSVLYKRRDNHYGLIVPEA